ncbi:MAG: hypothetical protein QOJ09_1763, partial [Actinomycetota bacterium]|nr:hypothetical protein [Actinomycetota bacterium]
NQQRGGGDGGVDIGNQNAGATTIGTADANTGGNVAVGNVSTNVASNQQEAFGQGAARDAGAGADVGAGDAQPAAVGSGDGGGDAGGDGGVYVNMSEPDAAPVGHDAPMSFSDQSDDGDGVDDTDPTADDI